MSHLWVPLQFRPGCYDPTHVPKSDGEGRLSFSVSVSNGDGLPFVLIFLSRSFERCEDVSNNNFLPTDGYLAGVSEDSMRHALIILSMQTYPRIQHTALYLFRGNDYTTGPQPFILTLAPPPSGAALEAE